MLPLPVNHTAQNGKIADVQDGVRKRIWDWQPEGGWRTRSR